MALLPALTARFVPALIEQSRAMIMPKSTTAISEPTDATGKIKFTGKFDKADNAIFARNLNSNWHERGARAYVSEKGDLYGADASSGNYHCEIFALSPQTLVERLAYYHSEVTDPKSNWPEILAPTHRAHLKEIKAAIEALLTLNPQYYDLLREHVGKVDVPQHGSFPVRHYPLREQAAQVTRTLPPPQQ